MNLEKDEPTLKQREYLAIIASGGSTYDVAEICYVSQHTVRNTIVAAKERVGASSTSNLVAMAVDKGWIKRDNLDTPFTYTSCL
jgi:DNA-binding CsgD family transcriptional regulator